MSVTTVSELMMHTRAELQKDQNKMRADFLDHQLKVDQTEGRLDTAVRDTQFWLDKYATSFKEADKTF